MLTYKSTGQRVLLNLEKTLSGFEQDIDKITREIALDVLSGNLNRVHNQGKAADESYIGSAQYSQKSIYVSLNKSPKRFTAKGKLGAVKFKNGRNHRSGYFPGGYKQFRQVIGRNINFVNLQLSGLLKTKFTIQGRGDNYVVGFEGGYGSKVAEGLEKKYRQQIWGVSPSEEKQINLTVERLVNEKLQNG